MDQVSPIMSNDTYAIVRQVSHSITDCELTHLHREAIDLVRARHQHQKYTDCLHKAGYTLIELEEQADLPDAVFVEDTAIVLDELAVITRPGAASRQPEVAAVAQALASYRNLETIKSPATLDGGDVLCMDKTIFIGRSLRTNKEGADQLAELVKPFGYRVQPVPIQNCLHLKSAVSRVARDAVLLNPQWIDASFFSAYRNITVDAAEPHGANALLIDDTLIYSSAYERTAKKISELGTPVTLLDMSELAKAEGAVTCCSILFRLNKK
jgi:dimethylargininase